MDLDKIKILSESLMSMKTAQFMQLNWDFIGFSTEFTAVSRQKVIRTAPLIEYQVQMTKELNEAIKPIFEKYIKIYEKELQKETNIG